MKIKMTNMGMIDILNFLNKFDGIAGRLGYAIAKTKARIKNEVRPFQEEHLKLLQKFGVKDDDGKYSVPTDSENFDEFIKEFSAISDDASDIDVMQVDQKVFDETDIYCDGCTVKDYELLEEIFVIDSPLSKLNNEKRSAVIHNMKDNTTNDQKNGEAVSE